MTVADASTNTGNHTLWGTNTSDPSCDSTSVPYYWTTHVMCCPECGNYVEYGDKYCRHCGFQFHKRGYCPCCGQEIEGGEKC